MSSYYNYDTYVQNALLDVVKTILKRIQNEGILGDHHFYITFKTCYKNVIIPRSLLDKYPDEITIVLQYQFWNLNVCDNHFEISLSFNGNEEFLSIPYAAITGFVDPYVKFCLQFFINEKNIQNREDHQPTEENHTLIDESSNINDENGVVVSLDDFRKKNKKF